MTKLEHLQRIRAKCVGLLEIASKRTPGEWIEDACCCYSKCQFNLDGKAESRPIVEAYPRNTAFIAACAGRAEAGWRATIAAIDFILRDSVTPKFGLTRSEIETVNSIIAAWPEELL